MIKKTSAIFFIFLASIVILVHAVVPHHHHNSQICIESNHCQSDCYDHKHNTSEHNHNGCDGSGNCVLKQAVVIPVNSLRQEFKFIGGDNNNSPFDDFHAVLFSNERISFVPKIISIAQIPLKTSSHSWFVSTSSGLRAPPIV